jgi:hypothetical protein
MSLLITTPQSQLATMSSCKVLDVVLSLYKLEFSTDFSTTRPYKFHTNPRADAELFYGWTDMQLSGRIQN